MKVLMVISSMLLILFFAGCTAIEDIIIPTTEQTIVNSLTEASNETVTQPTIDISKVIEEVKSELKDEIKEEIKKEITVATKKVPKLPTITAAEYSFRYTIGPLIGTGTFTTTTTTTTATTTTETQPTE